MSELNPFQVPSCLRRADLEERRRERFRKGMVIAVIASAAVLVVLLVEGCVTQHAAMASTATIAVVPPPKPLSSLPPAVSPAPAKAAPAAVARPAIAYVVKSGDTLTRIAAQHHTTASKLKSLNHLSSDGLTVGTRLKLPPA